MTKKCFVIKSCLYFVVISVMLVFCVFWPWLSLINIYYRHRQPILKVWYEMEPPPAVPELMLLDTRTIYEFNSPSVESFIQASTTDNSLKGLAVYLNLTNACQTLDDVSKAKNQVHKIALVTLMQNDQTTCTIQDLAKNVQNAGYSMLIYCCATATSRVKNKVMIMIPVATVDEKTNVSEVKRTFSYADRTDVDILCSPTHGQKTDYLRKMESYLKRLYFWFLIGPLITLEWMRRTRKFCWMSDSQEKQRVGEERASENGGNAAENEIRTMEEGENGTEEPLASNYQESRGRNPGREVLSQSSEEQPLLVEFKRLPRHNQSVVTSFKKFFCKGVMCFSYLMLFIAALPISISCGSFSFFRFDHRVFPTFVFFITQDPLRDRVTDPLRDRVTLRTFLYIVLLLWSPLQIFCFLLYSRLACTTTWVVPINVLRLIRSEWFASNISLLVLAVVVPLCTSLDIFSFFATYNTVCTVCNMLFIFILNKHNFVTRYVFYISVCMIFAYLESSIVAVFYFVLNSQGSLDNLKLTALRTVAIGLTLKVSFSSSIHIVWKLNKPTKSLFEELSEK
ncbi:unnamed protein product [Porites evermanni]|uniref:Uncharacterized protein n=2 Tax=Porites TaxID=46719 RepID=A0ABN8T1U4_9CNID|nr:unnamed protein product [Porites evermanni]